MSNLICGISNHEEIWTEQDRDAVFKAMADLAPDWIAQRNEVLASEIEVFDTPNAQFQRYLLFKSSSEGAAYMVIHEEQDTGLISIVVGRGGLMQ